MIKPLAYVLVSVLFAGLAAEQSTRTLRVDVELMQTVAIVTDSGGHYVTDLNPDDFIIELNGERQTIAHFNQDRDTLVSLGLLVDYSSSMKLKFDAARKAAVQFVRGKRPLDQIFLMVFAGSPELKQDFTYNSKLLIDSISDLKKFGSGTDVKSAVYAAAWKAKEGIHRKRAVIVITDAGDTSDISLDFFRSELRRTEMLVYALQIRGKEPGFPSPTVRIGRGGPSVSRSVTVDAELRERPKGPFFPPPRPVFKTSPPALPRQTSRVPSDTERIEILNAIANETGGRWFPIDGDASRSVLQVQLDQAFAQITAELRGQFSIGFYPSSSPIPATPEITVRMKDPSKYIVRWRR